MDLLFITWSVELFFELLHGSVVQKLPFEAVLKLFFGTVEQQLTCKATPQGVMSISISRMLRWAQSELCWAQSNQSVLDAACSSRAQVALRSYFLSFCIELLHKSRLAKAIP